MEEVQEVKMKKQFKTGNDVVDYVKSLGALEAEYHGKDDLVGVTALSVPTYISSNRAIMFASHLKQFLNLKYRQLPRLRTNYEDIVGQNSSYICKAEDDCEVAFKIAKFPELPQQMYFMFTYNEEKDSYKLEIKRNGVEMPERFGFHINNEHMDNLVVGDKIKKGETLWKSVSYDEDDLYGYGLNARCIWLIDNWTHEDAIRIRKGFAEQMISNEEETITVPINDNVFMRDLYGDEENFRGFPEIGGLIKDNILCATSTKINSRVLYDMKKSNLRQIAPLDDRIHYAKSDHDARVVDIEIYSNKELDEIPDTEQNSQIRRYLENQTRFYQEIHETCKSIIESGSGYCDDIGFWYGRSDAILNKNFKFRKNNNQFSNIIMEFKVEREVGVEVGNKFTGRYGNKGVVSIITADEDMPFDENGVPVDMVFNGLGVINRLVSMPLYEAAFTGAGDDIIIKLKAMSRREDKEALFFKYMSFFDDRGMYTMCKEYYAGLNDEERNEFFQDVEAGHLYISIPPLWETEPLFYRLQRMYKELPIRRKQPMYIRKWGRTIRMMRDLVVGEQYIIKLKQSSKKGFSARSLGFVNMTGLPDKTDKMKDNLQLYSTTPIKNGIDDCNNMNIGVFAADIAKMHLLYRNSVVGTRELSKLMTENILDFEDFELRPEYTNRNVEKLNALWRCCGKEMVFPGDITYVNMEDETIASYMLENQIILTDPKRMREIIIDNYFRKKFKDRFTIVGTEDSIERQYQIFKEHEMNKCTYGENYVFIEDELHE